jgi:hypothetical protein
VPTLGGTLEIIASPVYMKTALILEKKQASGFQISVSIARKGF